MSRIVRHNRIERSLRNMRLAQTERVWPKIGALLDTWEGMSNDESGLLKKEYPHLYDAIKALNEAVDGE